MPFKNLGLSTAIALTLSAVPLPSVLNAVQEASAAKICTVAYVRGTSPRLKNRRKAIRQSRQAWRDVARNTFGQNYNVINAVKAKGSPGCQKNGKQYRCHFVAQACKIRQSVATYTSDNPCTYVTSYQASKANGCKTYHVR